MSEIKTAKVSPRVTTLQLGDSGDTITIPSGATIANSGTATGFGSDNTPAFSAYLSSDQTGVSDNVFTKVTFQTEFFDTDSAYNTSTGRFTVPSGEGGKYWVSFRVYIYAASGSGNTIATQGKLIKNGSTTVANAEVGGQGGHPNAMPVQFSAIVTLSAADYIEVQGYMNTSDSAAVGFGGDAFYRSYFGAYKMIGL